MKLDWALTWIELAEQDYHYKLNQIWNQYLNGLMTEKEYTQTRLELARSEGFNNG